MSNVVGVFAREPASGFRDRRHTNASRQIAVRFEDETYAAIKRIADARCVSFASIVRALCDSALAAGLAPRMPRS